MVLYYSGHFFGGVIWDVFLDANWDVNLDANWDDNWMQILTLIVMLISVQNSVNF